MATKKPEKNKKIKSEDAEQQDIISIIKDGVDGYLKYSPKNNKEEKELLLAKMIKQSENRLDDNLAKIENLKFELKKTDIENEVHKKVLAKNPKMKEEWKYNFIEDFYTGDKDRLKEIEDSIVYDEAWIGEAKKMITTKRYQDLPKDFFDYYHFDGENVPLWKDDDEFLDDMCEDEDCPICNNFDEPPF